MPKVILLTGVPCSGKSYTCEQLADEYQHIPHDSHNRPSYTKAILEAARTGTKNILAEAPFNAASLVSTLRSRGIDVNEHLVTTDLSTIVSRYFKRTGKGYPSNFVTNHTRYEADKSSRFASKGTSSDLIKLLKG